jgi:CHAT domain
MRYQNLDIEASNYHRSEESESFRVRVLASPAGEQNQAEDVSLDPNLRVELRQLERRLLGMPDMISFGEKIADSIFPPVTRNLLRRSRESSKNKNEGLRIRLKFESLPLAELPWEYAYISPPNTPANQKTEEGFLALDARISIVRYPLLDSPPGSLAASPHGKLRIVTLLASPKGAAHLNLEKEQQNIQKALDGIPRLSPEFYPDATFAMLQKAMATGADVFHFAGHGKFDMALPGVSSEGKGFLVLTGENGEEAPVEVTKVVINLKGHGIRLAFLGACETGRQDGVNAWSGIAPALVRGEIPAVVAMQYAIGDDNSIAFSKSFYTQLAAGESIDMAVTQGRIAISSLHQDGADRDFGVPVLYLRMQDEADGVLFARDDFFEKTEQVSEALRLVDQRMHMPGVRDAVAESLADFEKADAQIELFGAYKDVHDLLQNLEKQCRDVIFREAEVFKKRGKRNERSSQVLRSYNIDLRGYVRDVQKISDKKVIPENDIKPILNDLRRAQQELERGVNEDDPNQLDRAVFHLNGIFGTSTSRINNFLIATARGLPLDRLERALTSLRGKIPLGQQRESDQFNLGVDALVKLKCSVSELKDEHDQWQRVDNELRPVEADLTHISLLLDWERVSALARPLWEGKRDESWAKDMAREADGLGSAMCENKSSNDKRSYFLDFRREVMNRFKFVDEELKDMCDELRRVRQPLNPILEKIKSPD